MFVEEAQVNTFQQTTRPILILGGTGKTGRRIADQLSGQGLAVRIASRGGSPAFDWENRATWGRALEGAAAVYVSYYPDLAAPGAAATVGAFADLAVAMGVKRLVLLSGRGEPEAQRAEDMVKRAGADWTVLRCSWFMQNFSESFMLDAVLAGEVALPVGAVREPFIDADDIADAAVAAFTDDRHIGQLYELTGPRLLSFGDAVAEIAAASGRSVRFTEITATDFATGPAAEGLPPDLVALLMMLFTEVLDGRNEHVCAGVERALGRPARDFRDYARAAAASGVWGGAK
ncbi:NmrA family transcriptional regulator [Aminobacter sp. DSM 101952]|uniref:NAD(P)H-binding protein n=1 Tax=Aminobacter sp. DSM 101952 TaxID=2735891 RepID=UPI0006F4B419|nr:NAD(P)H-binding protein [Aminobacter sp. DSM 101952]KQU72920.1 NmrA family transcriptional regulator [Aminobacter sp. DSM 101952]